MNGSVTRVAWLAVMVVLAAMVVAWPAPAQARMAPETLADRRPVQAGPVEPGFPIDYVGVLWEMPAGAEHTDDEGAGPEPHGAVRFRLDGAWGPWVALIEDGADGGDSLWASGLVGGGDADAYQVRGVPADAGEPRAVAINTTDGPLVKIGETRGGGAGALASSMCRSRADWGADENWRLDSNGNEAWPPEYYGTQVVTVHHTATDNNDPDPESTVRAIYRYHAVDQGWGDIGYQYLVDESGVVYEGRWSGGSTSCELAGGDGADFAHEEDNADGDLTSDEIVTAAHTGGWNSGNIGVALLGEFTDHPRFGADPKAAAVASLEDVLTELAVRHGLDPLAQVEYVNPVSGDRKTVDTIGGHRDYTATECPGQRLYDQLPTIRQNVADGMTSSPDALPTVNITSPADGATVSGTVSVTADASDDDAVARVEFVAGGVAIGSDTDGADGWSATWDTTGVVDGPHTVTATAVDSAGQSAQDSVGVTVDNTGSSEPAPSPTDTVHVADLDGRAQSAKSDWWAEVTITVHDDTGNAVSGAVVTGTWTTTGTAVSCTTDSRGTCTVTSPLVHKSTETLTFAVDDLAYSGHSYASAANTDPDGDSDGTTITVAKVG